jgi:phosphoglycerate kinase
MTLYNLDDLGHAVLHGKRVLVRVDFNVPLQDGEVMDATRLEAALPTLRELSAAGARLVLVSHCGRPKGEVKLEYSLRPVAAKLGELIGTAIGFAEDCVGEAARQAVEATAPGAICLLENLRFHPGETGANPDFADRLAELADVYVGDAFGTAHRAHASVVGVAERLEHKAAGRLLVREVETLGALLGEPQRPFVGILGGAKISGKIDTLVNLLPRLDTVMVGGGMANTFLAAAGHDLADSLVEADRVEMAGDILEQAEASRTTVLLPSDLVVTDDLGNPRRIETVAVGDVPSGTMAVDVGDDTRRRFAEVCAGAATVFWNGPLGVFEKPPFDAGTRALAESLAGSSAFTVVGGGETVAAVRQTPGAEDRIGHISTGGGASLELLAGKTLPGVAILERPS